MVRAAEFEANLVVYLEGCWQLLMAVRAFPILLSGNVFLLSLAHGPLRGGPTRVEHAFCLWRLGDASSEGVGPSPTISEVKQRRNEICCVLVDGHEAYEMVRVGEHAARFAWMPLYEQIERETRESVCRHLDVLLPNLQHFGILTIVVRISYKEGSDTEYSKLEFHI